MGNRALNERRQSIAYLGNIAPASFFAYYSQLFPNAPIDRELREMVTSLRK